MNMGDLNTGDMPARPDTLHWVETLDAGAKVRFAIYSPQLWQVWTHYTGRTKPCFKNHRLCEGGHKEETLRWYAYVFGWHFVECRRTFLQLTLGAARMLREQIATGVSLRGMTVDAMRPGKKQGPMKIQVVQYCKNDVERLGPDCDPHASLFKLWKVNNVGKPMNLKLGCGEDDLPDSEKVA